MMNNFTILLFGHTRPLFIADVLKSLQKQNALEYVQVWIDGHQGISNTQYKTNQVYQVVSQFPVKKIHRHNGNLGFRKMMLQALSEAVCQYQYIMVLEDDCFPTHNAVKTFQQELKNIEHNDDIFSVYGHPFNVKAENEFCSRFQGWGWGTTRQKLSPFLEQLIDCYSLTEERYLEFVHKNLSKEVLARLDITPPRNPSRTLTRFFAWDETLALLTALANKKHKKTPQRTIYNFGASSDSSRFDNVDVFASPPFNMVSHEVLWDYFNNEQ